MADAWRFRYVEQGFNDILMKDFRGERDGYIRVGEQGYFFPSRFAKDGPDYLDFQPRASDIWLITFPRSGTTMTQELIWLLNNNFDFKTASQVPLTKRFPFFEFSSCVNYKFKQQLIDTAADKKTIDILEEVTKSSIEVLNESDGRRFIKTHLPFSLLNPNLLSSGAKIIYVARNPKDVATSYFHLHKLFRTLDYTNDWSTFQKYFENDCLMWCPYWEHLNEGLSFKNSRNVLFLNYEDIIENLPREIKKLSNFFNVHCDNEDLIKLQSHLKIDNFRENRSVNFEFLRGTGILNDFYNERFIRNGGKSSIEVNGTIQMWTKKYHYLKGNAICIVTSNSFNHSILGMHQLLITQSTPNKRPFSKQ